MKIAYSGSFFAGVLASVLCVAPTPTEAMAFGYVGLKSGYSSESFSKTTITFPATNLAAPLKNSSSYGVPVGLDIGFGYYITPSFGFRLEAEYLYRIGGKFGDDVLDFNNNFAAPNIAIKHQADISNVLGNVYLDYYVIPSVYLYVGAGVGTSLSKSTLSWRNTTDNSSGKVSTLKEVSLAWQVGAGVGVSIWKSLELDLNVRYVDFGKAQLRAKGDLNASGDLSYKVLEALVGFKYRF